MMLMLIMTLRCNDIDVDDVIVIDVCCVCTCGDYGKKNWSWINGLKKNQ